MIKSACPEPASLFAAIGTTEVPVLVGVPEIRPLVWLTVRPSGRFIAPKFVGLLVAVI